MRQQKFKTVLDLDPLITDEERAELRAELEAVYDAWPDRMMKPTTIKQRERIRQLARRQRDPIAADKVRVIAANERKSRKHGYLKRTGAQCEISARRVAQIIKSASTKKTRK